MNIYEFWKDVLKQDAKKIRAYFHPDAAIRWHCTNEHFTLEEFIIANCEYPGEWDGKVERIEQMNDLYVTVTNVYPTDKSACFHVTSFIRQKEGKIISLDEYWADDGDAPRWRKEKQIGQPIR